MSENQFRLGICGLGTVGSALIKILQADKKTIGRVAGRDVVISAVSARDKSRDRGVDLSDIRWFDDPLEMAQDPDIDAVIELIGGTNIAKEIIFKSLENRKCVITANKAVMASHAVEIHHLSKDRQTNIFYDAAVGGAIPVIKVLRNGVQLHKVTKIEAVLNGTCNFILDEMAKGQSYEDALVQAQAAGFAEADPSMDVEGTDTAQKLAILYMLCFGRSIKDIPQTGITQITQDDVLSAKANSKEISLVGSATEHDVWVKPLEIDKYHLLANLEGAMNAILLETEHAGPLLLQRLGAGGKATATAVLSDIIMAVRSSYVPVFGWPDFQ